MAALPAATVASHWPSMSQPREQVWINSASRSALPTCTVEAARLALSEKEMPWKMHDWADMAVRRRFAALLGAESGGDDWAHCVAIGPSTNYHTSGNAGNIISHDPEPVMSFAGGKGYRGSHNMLKNLGDSIAQKFIAEGKLPKEKQSFRTTSLNTLRFENHANTSMPGYTGKTRLIR